MTGWTLVEVLPAAVFVVVVIDGYHWLTGRFTAFYLRRRRARREAARVERWSE